MMSASSYGHFTAAKECWSQCHIFRGHMITGINKRRIQKSFGEGLESFFCLTDQQLTKGNSGGTKSFLISVWG